MRKVFEKGFTLAEMLVVLFIIGVLAGIGVPIVSSIMNDSSTEEFVTNAKLVEDSVSMYYRDYGVMPISESGDASDKLTEHSKQIIKSKLVEAGIINADDVLNKLIDGKYIQFLKFEDVKEYTSLNKTASGLGVFVVVDMVEDLSSFGTYENDIAGLVFSTENRDKSSGVVYSGAYSVSKESLKKDENDKTLIDKEAEDVDKGNLDNKNKSMFPYGFRTKSSEDLKNGKANLTVTWTDRFVDKSNDLTPFKGFTGGKYQLTYVVCDINTSDLDCLSTLNSGTGVTVVDVPASSKTGNTFTHEFTGLKYGKIMMKLKGNEVSYGGEVIPSKTSKEVLLDAPSNFDAEDGIESGNGKTPDGKVCTVGVDADCYLVGLNPEGEECLIGKDADCFPIGITPDGKECRVGYDDDCYPIGLDKDGNKCAIGYDRDCFVIGITPDGKECRLGYDKDCNPLDGTEKGKDKDGNVCDLGNVGCFPTGTDKDGEECLLNGQVGCFVTGITPEGEVCRLGYDTDCYQIGITYPEGVKCAIGIDEDCSVIGINPEGEVCAVGLAPNCKYPEVEGNDDPDNPGKGHIPGTKPGGDGDGDGDGEGGLEIPVAEPGEGVTEILDSNPSPEDFYKTYQSYEKNKVTVKSEFNGLRIEGVSVGDFIVLKEVKLVGSSYEFDKNNFKLFKATSTNILIPKNPYLQRDFQINPSSSYKYVLEFYKNKYLEEEIPQGYVPASSVIVEYK